MPERNGNQPDLNSGYIEVGLPERKPNLILKTVDVTNEIVYSQTLLKKEDGPVVFEYGYDEGKLVCRVTTGLAVSVVDVDTAENQLAKQSIVGVYTPIVGAFGNNPSQLAWMIKRHAPKHKEGVDVIDV